MSHCGKGRRVGLSRSLAGHHVLFWPSLRKFAFVNEKRPEARLEDKTHADQKKCLPKIVMRSKPSSHAEVVELVDTLGSGSSVRKDMGVRVSPSAPSKSKLRAGILEKGFRPLSFPPETSCDRTGCVFFACQPVCRPMMKDAGTFTCPIGIPCRAAFTIGF